MTRKQPKPKPTTGVDEYGRTPLHHAAVDGDAGRVRRLLDAGADAAVADADGWTPLHFAAQAASAEIASLLIAAGAPVDARDAHGNTALFRAVFASEGDGAVIQLLLRSGADPHLANDHGVSPVQLAERIANYDVARFFREPPEA